MASYSPVVYKMVRAHLIFEMQPGGKTNEEEEEEEEEEDIFLCS